MISLISKWKLKNGCPVELVEELKQLAHKVEESEEGTLMYIVNLQAASPLGTDSNPVVPGPAEIPPEKQTEVIFIEAYRDATAFNEHIKGQVFTEFKNKTLKYFQPDPESKDWPLTETEFLTRQSDFIRQ